MTKILSAMQSALGVRSWGCRQGMLNWRWVMYHNI